MNKSDRNTILLLAALAVFLYGAYRAYGFYMLKTVPFEPLSEQEVATVLEFEKYRSCEEFLAMNFDVENPDGLTLFMQGYAYDKGLCVPQDIHKATQLYERTTIWYHALVSPILRLGMIYHYGPSDLRDKVRADFLFRQAAIALAPFTDPKVRRNYIKRSTGTNFTPAALTSELSWLDSNMEKSFVERQSVAIELRAEGYQGTDMLWQTLRPGGQ